ncbi:MAG TPA: hypothetical protein VGC79_15430 [Polyangiaceae bacterium]
MAFVVSRVVYYGKGIRFDISTIDSFAQLLDRVLLRERLAESLLYLHSQPPLYNLLTGVALKLDAGQPERLLWPLFMAAGLYTAWCLYFILLELSAPWPIAAALAAFITTSPPFELFENWYFYPHLDVAWLVGAVAWLCHSRGCAGKSLAISASHLVGLSLTRSLFHPLFYGLAALITVVLIGAGARRRALACFAVPGLLLFAWCAKNLLIFGFFGTSSWASRNFSHSVVQLLGPERVLAEVRLGHLSPAATLAPFESGERNVQAFGLPAHATGVPALDNTRKAYGTPLPVNYNHWSYPPSARFYAADTRHLLAQYPVAYLRAIAERSVRVFFAPVDQDGYVMANRHKIVQVSQAFDALDQSGLAHWLLGVGLTLAALCAPWASRGRRMVLALSLFAICWAGLVGIFGDFGENYRFRYEVLWFGWVIAAAGYFCAARAAGCAFWEARRAFR